MSTIISDSTSVGSKEYDQMVADRVLTMRRSLGVTVAQLARATGMPRRRIKDIEGGDGTTHAERHDIAVALGWLANNHVAKGRRRIGPGHPRPDLRL